MKSAALFGILSILLLGNCSENTAQGKAENKATPGDIKVGGNCEGCEAVYESPVLFDNLNEVDTLPDFRDEGPKLELSGIIYKADGKTPAPGVVLYIYHTDQNGLYSKKENVKGWAKRHGHIRGWIKTDKNGYYKFYTLVPASYPNSTNPKHIHPVIKEPGFSEYWIDEFVFADDPLLPQEEKSRPGPIGGSGVLKMEKIGGMLKATRNIILGLNVRDYPK